MGTTETGIDANFLSIMDGFCVQVDEGSHAAVPPVFGTPNATGELRQFAWPDDTDPKGDGTGTALDFENYYTKQTGTGQDNAGNAQGTFDRFINEGGRPGFADSPCPAGLCTPDFSPGVMQEIILAMPRKYRAIKNGLRFYAGSDTFAEIVKANGTGTNTGAWPASYEYANAYLGGAMHRNSVAHRLLVFLVCPFLRFLTSPITVWNLLIHKTVFGVSSGISRSTVNMLLRRTPLSTPCSCVSALLGRNSTQFLTYSTTTQVHPFPQHHKGNTHICRGRVSALPLQAFVV